MKLTVHSVDQARRSNEAVTVTVPIYSTEPGVVTASAPGCTFPDGADVVIAGTRTWALDNSDGNAAAAFGGALGNTWANYSNYAYFLKIDQARITEEIDTNLQRYLPLIASIPGFNTCRDSQNFYIWLNGFNNAVGWGTRRPAYKAIAIGNYVSSNRYIYYAVKHVAADSQLRHIHTANGGTIQTLASVGTSVPYEGQSYLLIKHCAELYILPVAQATDQKMIDWAQTGAAPSGYEERFTFNEEGAVVYGEIAATSEGFPFRIGLNYRREITGCTRLSTDSPGDPVVPASSIRVTIPAGVASPVTLTLTRPRAGVPSRASEAEKTESTTGTITLTTEAETLTIGPDVVCQVPDYPQSFALLIASNYDGACTVVSDNAALVPTSPVTISGGVAVCACTVTADVTGATVTATGPGGDTDACSVTVSEVPEPAELLSIGPDVDLDVESYPASINLLIASNVDGPVSLASDDPNLLVLDSVDVVDGEAEITALALADIAGATITASRPSGATDEAIVSVHDVLTGDWIAAGPNCRTRIEGKRIVWPIRVRSSKDGAFTATADPTTGIIIAGPFVLASGACDITAQPTQAGTWVLTVTQDGRTDSVTLEALAAAAPPTVRQYNLSADIDGFFDFINRKYGFRPRFTPANVQDVRAEHSTDRTFSRYAHGSGQPGSVFGAVALSYQVMISYSSVTMAEQDLGILREEADRYGWDCIGFSMTGQTMFEPIKMMPRLTLTLNFDIIPQGR